MRLTPGRGRAKTRFGNIRAIKPRLEFEERHGHIKEMIANYFGPKRPEYLILSGCLLFAPVVVPDTMPLAITSVLQFDELAAQSQQTNRPVRLEGIVCWSDLTRGMIILQDTAGASLIELDPQSSPIVPGEHITVEGNASEGHAVTKYLKSSGHA